MMTMTVANDPPVRVNQALDKEVIRRTFSRSGRVHIQGFFEPSVAQAIYEALSQRTPWQLCFNSGPRHVDIGVDGFESLSLEDREKLVTAIHHGARRGFQYFYAAFPLYDLYAAGLHRDHYLMRVYEFLNSEVFLEFVRDITGTADIEFADAQATLYQAGHFLTTHDDLAEGKHRRAAYVLNFTPQWRADWGGVLQFIDADGHLAEGYVPAFNALNLFRVPQKHSVSYVTPAANGGRYSITGWLRARD